MTNFYKLFGAGLSTTCQYFHVYKDKKDSMKYKVSLYCMLNGLGIAHTSHTNMLLLSLRDLYSHLHDNL